MDDRSSLGHAAYAAGISPIEWAVRLARAQLEVQAEVLGSRATDPDAYPGYLLPLTDDAVARRIVGELLNAGWNPPEQTIPEEK
ncbi:hypothetical protein [Micromonospora sp. Mcm103]|uniref:hypothetical protein n=1 Tax=Micromonospora sp. Mcm103 TaxID=2926015 RepID=UPI0021CAB5B2|nr:hypothetical protein [Micromonospora sp. Mcm103]